MMVHVYCFGLFSLENHHESCARLLVRVIHVTLEMKKRQENTCYVLQFSKWRDIGQSNFTNRPGTAKKPKVLGTCQ